MKKAVIISGGKQYLVHEGQTLEVDLVGSEQKTLKFEPIMVLDGDKVSIGTPTVTGALVSASVEQPIVRGDKVLAIRYKAKKRVHKIRGHRQGMTLIKISKIA